MTDREVAEAAVRRAGDVLLEHRKRPLDVAQKSSAADLVSEADHAAEAAVVELLAAERPGDGVMGEEGARSDGARTWVVDALDGTFNFLSGIPQFCAAVALVEDGEPLASAVVDPSTGELFSAARGEGATCDGAPLRARAGRALADALVSTYADPRVLTEDALVRLVRGAAVVRTGGAGGLELAWLAAGRIDGWAQIGTLPWDWLPGALLVREAGGRAEVRDGGLHLAGGSAALVDELEDALSRDPPMTRG